MSHRMNKYKNVCNRIKTNISSKHFFIFALKYTKIKVIPIIKRIVSIFNDKKKCNKLI